MFVAGFSGFLVVGLSALVDPASVPGSTSPEIGVVDGDTDLVAALIDAGAITREFEDPVDAFAAFDAGRVDGLVIANATGSAEDPVTVSVVIPEGELRATFTLVTVKNALESYEERLRTERLDRLVNEPLYVGTDARSGSYAFVYGLLIPLLVFLPVVLAGALTADSLTEEVQRGTLPLLLVTPATAAQVVEGKLVANALLAPLLSVAWFALLALNDLTVPWTGAAAILVLAFAVAVLLGVLACGIALFTRDRNKAHVVYATALMLLFTLALALPASPVNAVARLAAGSGDAVAYAVVAASVLAALSAWAGLAIAVRRFARGLATGAA